MKLLVRCGEKLSKLLRPHELERIYADSADYAKEGVTVAEAEKRAVRDNLADIEENIRSAHDHVRKSHPELIHHALKLTGDFHETQPATDQNPPAHAEAPARVPEKPPQESPPQPRDTGLAPEPQRTEPVRAPEKPVSHVAEELRKYESENSGVTVRAKQDGDGEMASGLATHRTSFDVIHDAPTLEKHVAQIDQAGGDGKAWLRKGLEEEKIHHKDLLLSGDRFEETHDRWWKSDEITPPKLKELVRAGYPEASGDSHLMAELLRMKVQTMSGKMTEELIPGHPVGELRKAVEAWNPEEQVAVHLRSMEAPLPTEALAPEPEKPVPAEPEKPQPQQPPARGPPDEPVSELPPGFSTRTGSSGKVFVVDRNGQAHGSGATLAEATENFSANRPVNFRANRIVSYQEAQSRAKKGKFKQTDPGLCYKLSGDDVAAGNGEMVIGVTQGKYHAVTADPSGRYLYDHTLDHGVAMTPEDYSKMVGGFDEVARLTQEQVREIGTRTGKYPTPSTLGLGPASSSAKPADSGSMLGAATPQPREVDPLGFYSHLAQTVKEKVPNRASVDQIVSTLKAAGVKGQEIEWTGLPEYLRTQTGPVDKAALLNFIRAGGIQLREVQLQDSSDGSRETRQLVEAGLEPTLAAHAAQAALTGNEETVAKVAEQHPAAKPILDAAMEVGASPTRFATHALPGGTNYKEVLLTLPENSQDARFRVLDDKYKAGTITPEESAEMTRLEKSPETQFRSSHWPDTPNVVAHFRQSDHVDAENAKARVIEEDQSDWHQKGLKEGYLTKEDTSGWVAEDTGTKNRDGGKVFKVKTPDGEDYVIAESPEEAIGKLRDSLQRIDASSAVGVNKVPDAPFKKTWMDLAFKRALALAVEDGVAKIAWPTGKQQAARYSLANQLDTLEYSKARDGNYFIQGFKGRTRSREAVVNTGKIKPEEVEGYVGKELAQKILSDEKSIPGGPVRRLEAGQLEVGGEGMKTFYDKIFENFIRGYVKKWGGAVSTTVIPAIPVRPGENGKFDGQVSEAGAWSKGYDTEDEARTLKSVTITPQMVEAVRQGQTIGALSPSAAAAAAAKAAGKGAPASRKDAKTARAAMAKPPGPGIVSRTVDAVTGATKALTKTIMEMHDFADVDRVIGEWQSALQVSDRETQLMHQSINKQFPNPLSQMAINRYADVGGDETVLREQMALSKDKVKPIYERALNLNPAEKEMAEKAKEFYEKQGEFAVDNGVLKSMISDYVSRVIDKSTLPENEKDRLSTAFANEWPEGKVKVNLQHARQRVNRFIFDLEQKGIGLKTQKIGDNMASYAQAVNRTVIGRQLVSKLPKSTVTVGKETRPAGALSGYAKPVPGEEGEPGALLIKPSAKPEEVKDYMPLDHPAFRGWKYMATDADGKQTLMQSDLLVHPAIYQRIKNTFGTSALNKIPAIRWATQAQYVAKQLLLGWSAFHIVQTGTHFAGMGINPFGFEPVNLDDPVLRRGLNHGLNLYRYDAMQAFGEGLGTSGLAKYLGPLGRLSDELTAWTFQEYIPAMIAKTYKIVLAKNEKRFAEDLASGKITMDQVEQHTAREANGAGGFGNERYEGTNPTAKHVASLFLLAPRFLLDRIEWVGRAFTKYGVEERRSLIWLALTMALTAKLIERMLTGKNDWSKPFTVVTPHREYELRSVPGDIIEMIQSPRRFVNGRLSPLISRPILESLTGKDFRGRNRTVLEQIEDVLKTPIPITVRGFVDKDAPELTPTEQIVSSTGLRTKRHSSITDARILGHAWQESQGKQPDDTVYPPSKYLGIRQALEDSNLAKARTNYYNLLRTMTREQINKGFTESLMHPFSGAAKTEAAFVQSLHGDDLRTYYAATAERNRIMGLFSQISGYRGPARNPLFAKAPPPVFSSP